MIAKTQNMTLMRGDTARIGIGIKGLDGTPEAVTFSVKKLMVDKAYIFQKTLESGIEPEQVQTGLRYVVTIEPEDTEPLIPASYYYDLEVIINGDVVTLLVGEIALRADVTRHLEEVSP